MESAQNSNNCCIACVMGRTDNDCDLGTGSSYLSISGSFSSAHIGMRRNRYSLKGATVTGTLDSTGKLSTLYEEKINPGLSLLLSGEADYPKKDFRFGIGFNIGG